MPSKSFARKVHQVINAGAEPKYFVLPGTWVAVAARTSHSIVWLTTRSTTEVFYIDRGNAYKEGTHRGSSHIYVSFIDGMLHIRPMHIVGATSTNAIAGRVVNFRVVYFVAKETDETRYAADSIVAADFTTNRYQRQPGLSKDRKYWILSDQVYEHTIVHDHIAFDGTNYFYNKTLHFPLKFKPRTTLHYDEESDHTNDNWDNPTAMDGKRIGCAIWAEMDDNDDTTIDDHVNADLRFAFTGRIFYQDKAG